MKRRLAIGGRLDRYVAYHFVGSYVIAAGFLVGLFVVLDATSNVDRWMDQAGQGPPAAFSQIVAFYASSLPYMLLQVAPFVTLMAAMFTVNRLLKKNEVAPILAAGVSTHRTLLPVYLGALLAGAGMLGLREACGRWVAGPRDALHQRLNDRTLQEEYLGIVIRHLDGSLAILDVFRPRPADGGPPEIEGLTVRLRQEGTFTKVEAPRARWDGTRWRLEDGLRTRLIHGVEAESEPVGTLEDMDLPPGLVATYRRARDAPLELTFDEVRRLLDREPDQPAWATLWHYHLTFALANLVLVLVGIPLMFSHESGHGSERLALGGLLCVFYFALDFVLRTMGLSGGLSPVLASWAPVLVFGTLGVFLTESMRS